MSKPDLTTTRLDDAARAGWLYYVAGNTQDQIATKLGISRQTAQRLVSLAVSEGLVRVRLDHPIANCLDLAARLRRAFRAGPGPEWCRAIRIPARPRSALPKRRRPRSRGGCAHLDSPIVMAIGTGRTLKAAIEQLPPMDCQHHKVVSLTGNISSDGSAAFYNVIFTMSDPGESAQLHHAAAGHRFLRGRAQNAA